MAPQTRVTPPQATHLFLLAGQSNMAGRGLITADRREPIPGVMALQEDGGWGPALDPLHWDKPIAGVGLARSFARAYLAANPGVTVGFIPAACGGSPVESWVPGHYFAETKSFPYDDAMARTESARRHGVLKGILWHQGESDSSPERAALYEERLVSLFQRFRQDLGDAALPIVVGQLGRFTGADWSPAREKIDAVHQHVAAADAHVVFVSAEGLGAKEDLVHFDAAALDELGLRYAEAWRRLHRATAR